MSEQKHTPEPWKLDIRNAEECICSTNYTETCVVALNDMYSNVYEKNLANAQRIVDCVNAMQGIENPIERMRCLKEELEYCQSWLNTYFDTGSDRCLEQAVSKLEKAIDLFPKQESED